MRNNLISSGIAGERDEDTETKLKEFIKDDLKIRNVIVFDQVHR